MALVFRENDSGKSEIRFGFQSTFTENQIGLKIQIGNRISDTPHPFGPWEYCFLPGATAHPMSTMRVYIYVCVFVCVYSYTNICIYMYTYKYLYIYTYKEYQLVMLFLAWRAPANTVQ
jgi:hypothetical protein